MPTIILALAAIVFFAILQQLVRNYLRLPRSFQGPLLACLTDGWLCWRCITAKFVPTTLELLKQHGPIRIGPNLLLSDDPEFLRYISLPRSRWTRGSFYDGFDLGHETKNVFAERDEKRHRELRSKLGPAYSGKGVDNVESSLDSQVLALLHLLKTQYATPGKALDMTKVFSYFALDFLSTIAFGQTFGFLAENGDKWKYIASNQAFFHIFELVINNSTFHALFKMPFLQALLAPKETDEFGLGRVTRFAAEAIVARFGSDGEEGGHQRNDMLASFKSHGLSLEECKSESLLQILAGSDSTSSTLRNTMLFIVSNPRIYMALRKEVDSAVDEGRAPADGVVKDSVARQLPYLQAVIWEGLRKMPPLLGLSNKVAPPEGEKIGDVFYPGGCEVAISFLSLTHREDVFGPDAHIFRPERWLEGPAERRYKYERVVDLVFGTGRYGCLGRNIAWMELGKVLFELIRHFDWEIVDPFKPVELNEVHQVWLQSGMNMIVTSRQ